MNDQAFRQAFEARTLPEVDFDHAAHVRMAWLYVKAHPLEEAIHRFSSDLRAYTQALGAPGKYHATITWFFLLLINDRVQERGAPDWVTFQDQNPDLIGSASTLLQAHYSRDRLGSEVARKRFVLPDRVPLTG